MDTRCILLVAILLTGLVVPPVAAQPVGDRVEVHNVPPRVVDLDVPALVTPVAGGDVDVTITFKVRDPNGWQDIAGAQVTVTKPDNTTVHVPEAAANATGAASGAQADYTYTFPMAYHHAPADHAQGYVVRVVAHDHQGAASEPAQARFGYASLAALRIDAASLSFGTTEPGERTEATTLEVENLGNVVIDLETAGVPLDDGDGHTIPVDRIRYDTTNGTFYDERALAADPTVVTGFDLAPGPDARKTTWWLLDVPTAEAQYLPAGNYQGAVTLSAVEST